MKLYSAEMRRYLDEMRRYEVWRHGSDEEKEGQSSAEARDAG